MKEYSLIMLYAIVMLIVLPVSFKISMAMKIPFRYSLIVPAIAFLVLLVIFFIAIL